MYKMVLIYCLVCNLLFVPLICGTSNPSKLETNSSTKLSPNISDKLEVQAPKMKETLVSEGGAITDNTPSLSLQKANGSVVSYKESTKDTVPPAPSKVVPRKGVEYSKDNSTDTLTNPDSTTDNKGNEKKTGIETKQPTKTTTTSVSVSKAISTKASKSEVANDNRANIKSNLTDIQSNKTKDIPKKPLVVSYEVLSNMNPSDLKLPAIKSSANTWTPDQMPLPSKESEPTTKKLPISASKHPGMVIPVVITILVVPMFAVLGYMALRRGQEAWKNRHYKRMDFLLDGMYND